MAIGKENWSFEPMEYNLNKFLDDVIKEKGVKKKWIADALGFSKQYIYQLTDPEKPKVMNTETFLDICRFLKIDLGELCNRLHNLTNDHDIQDN